ncbi:hypothetical protein HO133_005244 [Letharia lupina]|uniref:Uncharacterized protein n=1 Tax=Letharia lupina TaxID=560253 RepID=A0A8H6C9G1_9LECA|nr:uncharacterized protein HO133_005244 [Letharia lupina]KAF6219418.1 hypothetical protein HO133_005244 [Letharia lupina]
MAGNSSWTVVMTSLEICRYGWQFINPVWYGSYFANAVLDSRKLLRDAQSALRQTRDESYAVVRHTKKPATSETLERETLKKAKTLLERDHPIVLASRESLACILWAQKDANAKSKEAIEQIKEVLKAREKRQGWSHTDTQGTANLAIGMTAEGKEKEKLKKKIVKSSTVL